MISCTIRRSDLSARGACAEGLALFDCFAPEGELHISEWNPLHSVWLAAAYPGYSAWLRYSAWLHDKGIIPAADLRKADLYEANLRGADLEGADLEGADLEGADLEGARRS